MKLHMLRIVKLGVFLILPLPLHAQDTTPQAPTLEVYANLVQVPVLAMVPASTPPSSLQFAVSLDSGPPFPTPHVRLEGNDPVTLAILLDLSNGQQRNYDDAFFAAVATMAQQELRPADRVSVYSMDCQLERTADNIPADPEKLKRAIDEAIHSPEVHRPSRSRPSCLNAPFLWDSIAYLSGQLTTHPGRRVVVAITDGHDGHSAPKLAELRNFLNMSAVAIFGFSVTPRSTPIFAYQPVENAFANLVQMSGGWVFTVSRTELPTFVSVMPRMLRRRYIVEFPRPDSLTTGPHSIVVTICDAKGVPVTPANVRPTGLSLPISDPAVLADPNTVPADPSQAPTPGDRRILTPPH
jgi:hypothetical protein